MLRHTYRTVAADLGVDDLLIHFLMGHTPVGISQKYIATLILANGPKMREEQGRMSKRMDNFGNQLPDSLLISRNRSCAGKMQCRTNANTAFFLNGGICKFLILASGELLAICGYNEQKTSNHLGSARQQNQ